MADVRLDPMTEDELRAYIDYAVPQYAKSHVSAGSWPEEGALERSAAEYARLLPDGIASAGHHLFVARDGQRVVGAIWFAERTDEDGTVGFVYDIRIYERYQGEGYGEFVMRAVEDKVRAAGLTKIRLHVFGNNTVARSLYRKLGYDEVHVTMDKSL